MSVKHVSEWAADSDTLFCSLTVVSERNLSIINKFQLFLLFIIANGQVRIFCGEAFK